MNMSIKEDMALTISRAVGIFYNIISDHGDKHLQIKLTLPEGETEVIDIKGVLLTECEVHYKEHVFMCYHETIKNMFRYVVHNDHAITTLNNYLARIRTYK